MDPKFLFCLALVLTVAAAELPDSELEDNEDRDEDPKQVYMEKSDYIRRPFNLQIRVPFFQMFLRSQRGGPSKLGLQVFPGLENGSLVDIDHRWIGKK